MQPALDVTELQSARARRSTSVPFCLTLQNCKSPAGANPALDATELQITWPRRGPHLTLQNCKSRRRNPLVYSLAIYGFAVLCLTLGQWASQ